MSTVAYKRRARGFLRYFIEQQIHALQQPLFAYPMMDEGDIKMEEVDDEDMR